MTGMTARLLCRAGRTLTPCALPSVRCIRRSLSSAGSASEKTTASDDRMIAEHFDMFHSETKVVDFGPDGDDSMGFSSNITGYDDHCFGINGIQVDSAVIVLPHSFLLWDKVNTVEDVSIDSLEILSRLHPTPEILLLGIGQNMRLPVGSINAYRSMPRTDAATADPRLLPFPQNVKEYFRQRGTIVEIMNSMHAATTFNVLNSEGRRVVAALLTPKPVPKKF